MTTEQVKGQLSVEVSWLVRIVVGVFVVLAGVKVKNELSMAKAYFLQADALKSIHEDLEPLRECAQTLQLQVMIGKNNKPVGVLTCYVRFR